MFGGQRADLIGVSPELRLVFACVGRGLGNIRRGGQQEHVRARREAGLNHAGPGGSRFVQSQRPVVEPVIDRDEIWPVAQHFAFKSFRPGGRVLPTNGGDDDVYDGEGEPMLESDMQQMRISIQGVHHRARKVSCRYAVPVTNDIDGPILWPVRPEDQREVG